VSRSSLVTGGTGFVGAQVVRALVERGESPVVFDINPDMRALTGLTGSVDFVRGDLGNLSQVLNVVKRVRPAVIYHVGGMLSVPSEAEPAASMRANALGTFHVLEAARLFEAPQVVFSSTVATFGMDIADGGIGDETLQRPFLFYGATKVFGEHMGIFFKRKYGLDFRGVRLPAIVGPGVKTPGIVQYHAWVIEKCGLGEEFTMWVKPETRHAALYFKDAARALVQLGDADAANLKRTTYTLAGIHPMPSAGELAEAVREQIPEARISFEPDPEKQPILDEMDRPFYDSNASEEWGWKPEYDLTSMVVDFLREMREHPERYF
jgi:threonine 3-dehydrogenase